jgi:tetratricopeptide (TPR) repeat protein
MSWKEKLQNVFGRLPQSDSLEGEAELLKAIQRETGEDFSTARERYQAYLREHPESHIGRVYLAATLRLLGKWDDALELLRDLHGLQSASPEKRIESLTTRISIGQVLYDKGEFDRAIAEFESLLTESSSAVRPLHGVIYLSLGTVYLAKGQRKEAQNAWKQAIKRDKSGVVAERAKELLKNNPA